MHTAWSLSVNHACPYIHRNFIIASLLYSYIIAHRPTTGIIHTAQTIYVKMSGSESRSQHVCTSQGLHDHYSELFTWMAALIFLNVVTQPSITAIAKFVSDLVRSSYGVEPTAEGLIKLA